MPRPIVSISLIGALAGLLTIAYMWYGAAIEGRVIWLGDRGSVYRILGIGDVGDVSSDGIADLFVVTREPPESRKFSSDRGIDVHSQGGVAIEVLSGADYRSLGKLKLGGAAVSEVWAHGCHDMDQDGYHDILVGWVEDESGGGKSHCVVVSVAREWEILASIGVEYSSRGFLIAKSFASFADFNGDGQDDFFYSVSCGEDGPGGEECGGLVVLASGRDGNVLSVIRPGLDSPEFGTAIALLDDFNADGLPELVVGDPACGRHGRVYCFSSGDWCESFSFTLVQTGKEGRLGRSLSKCNDFDGDGVLDLLARSRGGLHILSGANLSELGLIALDCDAPLIQDHLAVLPSGDVVAYVRMNWRVERGLFDDDVYRTIVEVYDMASSSVLAAHASSSILPRFCLHENRVRGRSLIVADGVRLISLAF